MRVSGFLTAIATVALLGCDPGDITTEEMEAAAIEQARQRLNIPPTVPLQAQVWAGEEWAGEVVLCGFVTGDEVAQRFSATADDPPRWLTWENAHSPTPPAEPDKFPNWANICDKGLARVGDFDT